MINILKNLIDTLKEEDINQLISNLFPNTDLWFVTEKYDFIDDCISIDEYLNTYTDLIYNNRYCNWRIKKVSKYVVIDNSGWFDKLDKDNKKIIIRDQVNCNRGLIIDSNTQDSSLIDYIYNDKLVLYSNEFFKLSFDKKKDILFRYLNMSDNLTYIDNIELPDYINIISNKYMYNEGFNCLACVLYCISGNNNYLNKWVNREEFINVLNSKYTCNSDINHFNTSDIIIFERDNKIIHAAYCIKDSIFINKNGQSIFNPILIKDIDSLKEEWTGCSIIRYCKKD